MSSEKLNKLGNVLLITLYIGGMLTIGLALLGII